MCMGGGGGNNPANEARRQEEWRQRRITSGTSQINSIFGGGQYGTDPVANWSKNNYGNYFTGAGVKIGDLTLTDPAFAQWTKIHLGSFDPTSGRFSQRSGSGTPYPNTDPVADVLFGHSPKSPGLTLEEAKRVYSHKLSDQGLLFGGVGKSVGFNDDFYNNRAQQYENYALPQLASQYGQTQKDMVYNLANKGLLASSAGTDLNKSLQRERLLQQQGLADTGIQQSQQLRQGVENQRNNLIAQLQASGDPTESARMALGSAANFQQPGAFTPIGNLFSNWANTYLARQYSQAYNPMMFGGNGNPYQQQNPYQQGGNSYLGNPLRTIQ